MWQKTMVYLGLVDEPEEHDELPENFEELPAVEPAAADPGDQTRAEGGDNVRPLRVPEPGAPHVRAMTGMAAIRVAVATLERFDDVAGVGDRFRAGQPVVFDVAGVDGTTSRRIVDFLSGMTYAVGGRIRRVGPRAFIVQPAGVEIPVDERSRLAELGYDVVGGGTRL